MCVCVCFFTSFPIIILSNYEYQKLKIHLLSILLYSCSPTNSILYTFKPITRSIYISNVMLNNYRFFDRRSQEERNDIFPLRSTQEFFNIILPRFLIITPRGYNSILRLSFTVFHNPKSKRIWTYLFREKKKKKKKRTPPRENRITLTDPSSRKSLT